MEKTTWKAIPGFADKYEASESGDIRSLRFYGKCNYGKILKPRLTKKGYQRVSLGAGNDRYIHRIIAELFVPNPLNLPEVNHKDCDKANNNKSNLEWCTHAQNMSHANENNRIVFSPEVRKKISDGRIAYWKQLKTQTI